MRRKLWQMCWRSVRTPGDQTCLPDPARKIALHCLEVRENRNPDPRSERLRRLCNELWMRRHLLKQLRAHSDPSCYQVPEFYDARHEGQYGQQRGESRITRMGLQKEVK